MTPRSGMSPIAGRWPRPHSVSMNAASNRDFEVEKLAVLREQGAISDEEYHEARRRFRMEVERLESQRARGTINHHQYQQARRHCAMRLTTAATETAQRRAKLSDPTGRLRARARFVLVCIASAAATWNLILYNRDPYSHNPLIIPTMLMALLFGPVALGMLISASNRIGRSWQPVPWQDQAMVMVGILLAAVGATETGYLVLMGMASNLAV